MVMYALVSGMQTSIASRSGLYSSRETRRTDSSRLNQEGECCLSHILLVTLVTADHVHNVFCFTCKLVPDGVSPACSITGKSVGAFY